MKENLDLYRKTLEEQTNIIAMLYQNVEISRLSLTIQKNISIINGEIEEKGFLIYKYALKDFLEFKKKSLFDGADLTQKELAFLESFDLIQGGDSTEKELEEAGCYVKKFLNKKYANEIKNNVDPDLNKIMEKLKKAVEKNKTELEAKKKEEYEKNHKNDLGIVSNLERLFFVNKAQARFLYSLERMIVQYDIDNTRNKSTQNQKIEWLKDWENRILDNLKIQNNRGSWFYKTEKKLYSELKISYNESKNKTWLSLIALECALFVPYTQLTNDKNKFKNLKCQSDYLSDVFCKKQSFITQDKIKTFKSTYKKYCNKYNNKTIKRIIFAAATAMTTVATGGMAFAFAPGISVALVDSSFVFTGAALTNASLAFIGGGALAIDGLGMAGGTAIIAGGGALVGVIGGATSSRIATTLLSVEGYCIQASAILLTFCHDVVMHLEDSKSKMKMIIKTINKTIEDCNKDINSNKDELKKKIAKEEKKKLKKGVHVFEDNLKCLEKCKQMLEDMINNK